MPYSQHKILGDFPKKCLCSPNFPHFWRFSQSTDIVTVTRNNKFVTFSFLSNKALPRLQRGPCCLPTGRSLQHNNGPIATPGGPYWSEATSHCPYFTTPPP